MSETVAFESEYVPEVTFCLVCEQTTLPLESGLCGWCMCDPETGEADPIATRRERNRLACQRTRARQRAELDAKRSSYPNDHSAGLNPSQVKRPALQEVHSLHA